MFTGCQITARRRRDVGKIGEGDHSNSLRNLAGSNGPEPCKEQQRMLLYKSEKAHFLLFTDCKLLSSSIFPQKHTQMWI